jgi:hypothetical protein
MRRTTHQLGTANTVEKNCRRDLAPGRAGKPLGGSSHEFQRPRNFLPSSPGQPAVSSGTLSEIAATADQACGRIVETVEDETAHRTASAVASPSTVSTARLREPGRSATRLDHRRRQCGTRVRRARRKPAHPDTAEVVRAGVKDLLRISDARTSGSEFDAIVLQIALEASVGGRSRWSAPANVSVWIRRGGGSICVYDAALQRRRAV